MPIDFDLYKSVVRITNSSSLRNFSNLGSGVVFSPGGLVITNNHVVEDPNFGTAYGDIAVEFLERVDEPTSNATPAKLVIRTELYDLAIIQVATHPSRSIDLLRQPTIGPSWMERRIRVLGYPPIGGPLITVTRGVVSGFDENQNLKTDAEINPGNSGGAALDDMDSFLGIPSFTISGEDGKLGFIVTLNRIIEWLTTVLKSGLPATSDRIDEAFTGSNLNFSGDNLDQSNKYPRILVKFAAVETLLSERKYEESIPQIQFILEKRPRSALAYHYLGNALLGLGRYREATNQYRHCLSLDPNHIPALGNLGVSLISLSREQEALQIFEQVIDGSDDPAELWTSYNNIAGIYERAKNGALSQSYRSKANELRQAAEQRLSEHTQRRGKGSKLEALLNAMVHAEIKMTE